MSEQNAFEWYECKKPSSVHFSSDTDMWATPDVVFDQLDEEFEFDWDVCASAINHKCQNYYDIGMNGLLQKWQGVCWMNPPYGREIGTWIAKAHHHAAEGDATVVCLIPSRTDTIWWHRYVMDGEIRFIKGRLRFGDAEHNAPFPSVVAVFRKGLAR